MTVGHPGNSPDANGRGVVSESFRISKFEIINSQYVEFLNTVDPQGDNDLELYHKSMQQDVAAGGIVLSTSRDIGERFYLRSGRENTPVNHVNWFSALRFVNWLNNGQGDSSTETGAYTLGGVAEPADHTVIARNAAAQVFLPTFDQWYKAAYYQLASAGVDADDYWAYATSSNDLPYSTRPPGTSSPDASNSANFNHYDSATTGYNDGYAMNGMQVLTTDMLSDVGAYTQAASYYGTFDQNGNISEWVESMGVSATFPDRRGRVGGSSVDRHHDIGSSVLIATWPDFSHWTTGFRVAAVTPQANLVPEPGTWWMMVASLLLLLIGKMFWRPGRCLSPAASAVSAPRMTARSASFQ